MKTNDALLVRLSPIREVQMWWWSSIDDKLVNRRVLAEATSKKIVYFLCGMAAISGSVALVGTILIANSANQIPSGVVFFVVGTLGFAVLWPWFIISFFVRHMLSSLRELEDGITLLRDDAHEHSSGSN